MAGRYSVDNLEDVIDLAKTTIVLLVKKSKDDGFKLETVKNLLEDPQFQSSVALALDGVDKIPFEAGEIDFLDGIELGRHFYKSVMEILEAMRK